MLIMTVSQKYNNYNYAPGIATYGINGQEGEKGNNGSSIFFTSFNIYTNRQDAFKKFSAAIKSSQLPVNNGEFLERPYQNGDYFFDNQGNIYELYNLEGLINDYKNNSLSGYGRYLKLCGKLTTTDSNTFINTTKDGRVNINQNYNGLDIIIANNIVSYDENSSYALRIISNTPDDNKISFITLSAINGQYINNNLEVYYDNALESYHIDSDLPIFINAEFKIKPYNDTTQAYDNYSSIVTSENPITSFYNLVNLISFNIYYSEIDNGKLKKITVDNSKIISASQRKLWENIKDNMYIKIVYNINSDEGIDINSGTSIYMKKYKDEVDEFQTLPNFKEFVKNYDINIISISLIRNIEVFCNINKN